MEESQVRLGYDGPRIAEDRGARPSARIEGIQEVSDEKPAGLIPLCGILGQGLRKDWVGRRQLGSM